eukprot:3608696-Rhodomonas_salina.1
MRIARDTLGQYRRSHSRGVGDTIAGTGDRIAGDTLGQYRRSHDRGVGRGVGQYRRWHGRGVGDRGRGGTWRCACGAARHAACSLRLSEEAERRSGPGGRMKRVRRVRRVRRGDEKRG